MPAPVTFAYVIERNGTLMDVRQLDSFGQKLVKHQHEEFKRLIKMIPGKVRRRHMEKGLKFSRTDFIRDALYSRQGFNLEVINYTKSTASLENEKERVPSTDKRTLAYYKDHPFVKGYLEWNQRAKLISTYINGMDKYLIDGKIYPTYWLSRTNTGRTASSDPNGQNLPKRGPLAKEYRLSLISMPQKYITIWKKRRRWKMFSLDYSQIELRLVASMANEPTMIDVYRRGGDIHRETGIQVAEITDEKYEALPVEGTGGQEDIRFKAKAVSRARKQELQCAGIANLVWSTNDAR